MQRLESFVEDRWVAGKGLPAEIASAITGETIALANSDGIDMASALAFARSKGGPEKAPEHL